MAQSVLSWEIEDTMKVIQINIIVSLPHASSNSIWSMSARPPFALPAECFSWASCDIFPAESASLVFPVCLFVTFLDRKYLHFCCLPLFSAAARLPASRLPTSATWAFEPHISHCWPDLHCLFDYLSDCSLAPVTNAVTLNRLWLTDLLQCWLLETLCISAVYSLSNANACGCLKPLWYYFMIQCNACVQWNDTSITISDGWYLSIGNRYDMTGNVNDVCNWYLGSVMQSVSVINLWNQRSWRWKRNGGAAKWLQQLFCTAGWPEISWKRKLRKRGETAYCAGQLLKASDNAAIISINAMAEKWNI